MPKVQKRQRNAEYVKWLIAQEDQARVDAARRKAAVSSAAALAAAQRRDAATPQQAPAPTVVCGLPPLDEDTSLLSGDAPFLFEDWSQSPEGSVGLVSPGQDSPLIPEDPCLGREGPCGAADRPLAPHAAEPQLEEDPGPQKSPASWHQSEDSTSEYGDDMSCGEDDSTEVAMADSAWDFPFSRGEKQKRLVMLLEQERLAARKEVRWLRKEAIAGSGPQVAPHRLHDSPRSGSPTSRASSCSSRACCSSEGERSRGSSCSPRRQGLDDQPNVGPGVSSVDYPFSRSEKEMLLTRFLNKERQAAEREARLLRGRTPWTPRGLCASSCSRS
mmetsp:Transcript_46127/g.144717  ORF Transcript_46127/g.144717 Transcript_46127/m.144717 type:complete len:330 (+) Transcript_46127:96-1085(+)